MSIKLCKDCKHCSEYDYACLRTLIVDKYVTGYTILKYCKLHREDPEGCGPEAKYFELKPKHKTLLQRIGLQT